VKVKWNPKPKVEGYLPMTLYRCVLVALCCGSLACGKLFQHPVIEKLRSRPVDSRYLLMITEDFGSVRRCSTRAELQQIAQTLISAKPDIIALDVSANGLCNYRSAIGHFQTGSAFDALFEQGIDPLQEMIDQLHAAGITVLANVRMNDHHGTPKHWTPWERQHVEWSLGRDTGARDWKSIGALRQMDFSIDGVRDYRFAILQEIIERYDVDGIQLDFGRTAPFLSQPKCEKAPYLTEYVHQVRRLLNQNNRTKLLSAIVPWDIDFCFREGMQVDRWIADQIIDLVCPGEWYYADWNIPLQRWKQWTDRSRCLLVPLTLGNVSPFQVFEYGEPSLLGENHELDGAKIRAIAHNYFAQDIDGMMFYNYYADTFSDDYPLLRDWLSTVPEMKLPMHFLNTRSLIYQPNELQTFDLGFAFQRLPLRKLGDWIELPFRCCTIQDSAEAILRLAVIDALPDDDLTARLNDCNLGNLTDNQWQVSRQTVKGRSVLIGETRLENGCLVEGKNVLMLQTVALKLDRDKPLRVGEFEIVVRPVAAER